MDLTMRRSEDGNRRAPTGRRADRGAAVAVASLFLLAVGGCGSLNDLLEVELPGNVEEADLDDPNLAENLVLGGVATFECGMTWYVHYMGMWAHELIWGSPNLQGVVATTRIDLIKRAMADCGGQTGGGWVPWHTSRVASEDAIERIEGWIAEGIAIPNSDNLIGMARLYAGYDILMLSEAYCEIAFDGGPLESRADGFRRADASFTAALASVGTGPDADVTRNAALIGRARARLNLGDDAGVLADASLVPRGFVLNATFDANPERRRNVVHLENNGGRLSIPSQSWPALNYRDLMVQGVPEPRIPYVDTGRGVGPDGITLMLVQLKYPAVDSPIPFATGREAQLMIAEVQQGQIAVDIINQLRATVDEVPWVPSSHPSLPLPQFVSSDPAEIEAQVEEERRRELWLQGHRMGDMLRWGTPFPTGLDQRGRQYGSNICVPVPDPERNANPNF